MTSPLITRLSKLDAPDREVDAEIMSLFYVRGKRHIGAYTENDFGVDEPVDSDVWIDPKDDHWVSTSAHCFTASVGAARALAKRVCDPAWIRIDEWYMGEDKPAVAAILPKPTPNETYGGKGANQAIALCIALLRAKEASNA